MRKVTGEEITIEELKKCYFCLRDNIDFDKVVDTVECNGRRYTVSEAWDAFICYPINVNSEILADYDKIEESELINITVYDFIKNWWGLDEFDLEEFIFYFAEDE